VAVSRHRESAGTCSSTPSRSRRSSPCSTSRAPSLAADGLFYVAGNLFVCLRRRWEPRLFPAARLRLQEHDHLRGRNTTPRVANVGRDPQAGSRGLADSCAGRGVSGMYFLSASNGCERGSMISLWRWKSPFGSSTFVRQGSVQSPRMCSRGGASARAFQRRHGLLAKRGRIASRRTTLGIFAALLVHHTVWGTHAIGCTQAGTPGRVCAVVPARKSQRWPTLLQHGNRRRRDPGHYRYFPSLAVDQAGNVALAYNLLLGHRLSWHPLHADLSRRPRVRNVLKAGEVTLQEPRYGTMPPRRSSPRPSHDLAYRRVRQAACDTSQNGAPG